MIRNGILAILLFFRAVAPAFSIPENPAGEDEAKPVSREEIRAGLFAYFGPGPKPEEAVDPRVEIVEKRDMGDHDRWLLRYHVHDDDIASAFLLLPKNLLESGEKRPLVLAPHPTSLIGKSRVVDDYNSPPADDRERTSRAARNYGIDLVRAGFVVFAPDRAGFGERRLLDDPEANVTQQMNAFRGFLKERWPGWNLTAGKNVWDLQRALDFLVHYPFIDAERIGSIGHSLGAWDSLMIAAMDERVQAIVVNSGGMIEFLPELWNDPAALREFLGNRRAQGLRTNVNPLLMLLAPRPMLYLWSLDDPYEKGRPNILEGLRTVHSYYELQYTGRNPWWNPPFSIHFHGSGHDFPPEARSLAYAWLARFLELEKETD